MKHDYDNSYSLDGMSGPAKCSPEPLKLELHDRVDMCGMEGTVIVMDETIWHGWPVTVKFDCDREILFLRDGRMYEEQKETMLKVIGKAKVKVKTWVYAYPEEGKVHTERFSEKDAAEKLRGKCHTKLAWTQVEVTHER